MAEANPHFTFGPFLKPTQGNWHGKKNGQTILKRREDTISQRAREQRGRGYTVSHFITDNKNEESTLGSSERKNENRGASIDHTLPTQGDYKR